MSVRITNAPPAYDYEGIVERSTTLPDEPGRKGTWRRLDMLDDQYYIDYQTGRYQSGLYVCLTEELFDDLVASGLLR